MQGLSRLSVLIGLRALQEQSPQRGNRNPSLAVVRRLLDPDGLELRFEGSGRCAFRFTVNRIKLETGLRPNNAGIPYTLLLRIEAIGFPTFGLLLQGLRVFGLGFRVSRVAVKF